jgi:ABC-type branched-subunit amino acid transport system permease subunit
MFIVATLLAGAMVALYSHVHRGRAKHGALETWPSVVTPALWLTPGVCLLPLLGSDQIVYKTGLVLIFFVAAIGLHVLVNWTGQLSLAHAAMVGVPTFVVLSLSAEHGISPLYLLPLGIVVGALSGICMGLPTLRAKDVQVALITFVAGIAVDQFFFTQPWLVGGASGQVAAIPQIGPKTFTTSHSLYPILIAVVGFAVLASWCLMRSKLFRAWSWMRADADAASALGIPVLRYRLGAYATAGAFAGLSGALTVAWVGALGGDAFPASLSFTYLLIVVVAGNGTVAGIGVATVLLQGGQQFASDFFGVGAGDVVSTLLAYGGPLGLIGVIVQYQHGLSGFGADLVRRLARSGNSTASLGQLDRTPLVSRGVKR